MTAGVDGRQEPQATTEDSLSVVLRYAREEYQRQDDLHDSLVRRSTTFLGFVAVFVGLVAAAPFGDMPWRAVAVVGLLVLLASVVLFVNVARLRSYHATPDIGRLIDKYLRQPPGATEEQVLSNTRDALKRNEATLKCVERRYQWGATLAGIGTVVIAAGIIVALVVE